MHEGMHFLTAVKVVHHRVVRERQLYLGHLTVLGHREELALQVDLPGIVLQLLLVLVKLQVVHGVSVELLGQLIFQICHIGLEVHQSMQHLSEAHFHKLGNLGLCCRINVGRISFPSDIDQFEHDVMLDGSLLQLLRQLLEALVFLDASILFGKCSVVILGDLFLDAA